AFCSLKGFAALAVAAAPPVILFVVVLVRPLGLLEALLEALAGALDDVRRIFHGVRQATGHTRNAVGGVPRIVVHVVIGIIAPMRARAASRSGITAAASQPDRVVQVNSEISNDT